MPIRNLKSWGETPVSEWLAGGWGAIHCEASLQNCGVPSLGPVQGRSTGQAPSLPEYLQAPVDNPVGLKVVIILSKWVDELLCHLGERQGSGSPQGDSLQLCSLPCNFGSCSFHAPHDAPPA